MLSIAKKKEREVGWQTRATHSKPSLKSDFQSFMKIVIPGVSKTAAAAVVSKRENET